MQRYEKEMACLHRHEAKLNGIRKCQKNSRMRCKYRANLSINKKNALKIMLLLKNQSLTNKMSAIV